MQFSRAKIAGAVWPAIPFPASTTMVNGRIESRFTSESRWSTYSSSILRFVSTPTDLISIGDPWRTKLSIRASPDSFPIGRALLKHSFIPL